LAAAKAIAGVSRYVLDAFLPADSKTPILEFTGDFNVATDDLKAGYYVLLGTADAAYPLPSQKAVFSVNGSTLMVDGKPALDWSYVILEVLCTQARGPSPASEWAKLLREAEEAAAAYASGLERGEEQQKAMLKRCNDLIVGAQALLRSDPTYLSSEAQQLVAASFRKCRDSILGGANQRRTDPAKLASVVPWTEEVQRSLGFAGHAEIDQQVLEYDQKLRASEDTQKQRKEKDCQAEETRQEADALDLVPA
jgi:hypothetical protein